MKPLPPACKPKGKGLMGFPCLPLPARNTAISAFGDKTNHPSSPQSDHSVIMQAEKEASVITTNSAILPAFDLETPTSSIRSVCRSVESSTAALQKANTENRQAQSFDPHSREVPSQVPVGSFTVALMGTPAVRAEQDESVVDLAFLVFCRRKMATWLWLGCPC